MSDWNTYDTLSEDKRNTRQHFFIRAMLQYDNAIENGVSGTNFF